MQPEFKQKSIRSFVIRGGRITESQKKAFDTWWPSMGLSLFDGMIEPKDVFEREAEVVLEVGFGMGDSLVDMAIAAPDTNFIGIEVHPPGVGRLINRAGTEGVTNLRCYMADANDVIDDCIPDASIDRFQLFFPDPWHKKKHHKRRIVQPEFIQRLRSKIKIGGHFHMATDWQPYAEDMLEKMQAAEGFENIATDGDYVPHPDYRPNTKFEKRGENLGHGVWDIIFERTS